MASLAQNICQDSSKWNKNMAYTLFEDIFELFNLEYSNFRTKIIIFNKIAMLITEGS